MKSETGNPYGTSISVVCRIGNVLQIDCGKDTAPDLNFIVAFYDIFSAWMRKLSISDEYAKAAVIEKGLMRA
jgi:hypothetical protein